MEQYKKDFIEFMIDCQVLKFGDFVTKSGRKTPFLSTPGFTALAPSCANSANTMHRRSKKLSAWNSMCFSALLTKGFRCR